MQAPVLWAHPAEKISYQDTTELAIQQYLEKAGEVYNKCLPDMYQQETYLGSNMNQWIALVLAHKAMGSCT